MKTFKELFERKKTMPPGEHVFDTKIKGTHLMIHKQNSKFVVYVDMEKFDSFKTLNDAKKAGMEFIKMAKD